MAGFPFDKTTRNRIAGRLAGKYIRFVKMSSSVANDQADIEAVLRSHHPCIFAMWHGQFMLLAPFSPAGMPVANMVARHGDAEIIGEALKTFEMGLVRGGGAAGRRKDRGGLHAFREALRLLETGTTVAMTADVPPGPARVVGAGIVKLAAMSGRPIIPIAVASSHYRTLDTWSRMTINLPFSRIATAIGEPIHVAKDADTAALERARLAVEAGLNDATGRAYALIGGNARDVLPHTAFTPADPPARAGLKLKFYRGATRVLTPAMPILLGYRERRGKEDAARRGERLGIASRPRPAGHLIWVHAASVGETNAVLPLLDEMRRRNPDGHFLLTTGTVTSAALARDRLATHDIHQFAPLDAPGYVVRFLDHWKPDLAVLTESEIWPNTIMACHERGLPIVLVNARMSERSYKRWRRNRPTARALFSRIRLILAQNERLARRFRELGGRDVKTVGNLKVDAPPLPVDEAALDVLRAQIGSRKVFLAASTHPGEDEIVIEAFRQARSELAGAMLIIAPRHPERGADVANMAVNAGLCTARRQSRAIITPETEVYVADTVGEMGVLYSLAEIAFIGGSLIEHGGQNPIEAIRLGTAVLTGTSQFNFADAYRELLRREGVVVVNNTSELAAAAVRLMLDDDERARLLASAAGALEGMSGALSLTADLLQDLATENGTLNLPGEGLKRAS